MEPEEVADTYLRKVEKMVARLATFGVTIPEAKLVWYIISGLHDSYREVKHQWRAHQATNNPLSLPTVVDLIKTTPVSPTPPAQPSLTSPSSSSTSLSSLLSNPLLETHALLRRPKLTPEHFAEYCSMQTCHRCGQRGHIQHQCTLPSPGSSSYAGTQGVSSSAGNPPVVPFGIGTLPSHPSRGGDGARSSGSPHGECSPGHPPSSAGRQFQNHCVTWATAQNSLPQGNTHLSFHMTALSSPSSSSSSSTSPPHWAWDSCADMHITSQAHLFYQLTYLP